MRLQKSILKTLISLPPLVELDVVVCNTSSYFLFQQIPKLSRTSKVCKGSAAAEKGWLFENAVV